jgi:outer membrane lipase/esterase
VDRSNQNVSLVKKLAQGAATLAFAAASFAAHAGPYTGMVVFGDSLSDPGNRFAETGSPGAPYFQGQASNGPVWTTLLGAQLGISAAQNLPASQGGTNFAFSGGATGTNPDASGPKFLAQQVALMAASGVPVNSSTLYIVAIGGNDVGNAVAVAAGELGAATTLAAQNAALSKLNTSIATGLAQVRQTITGLADQGARNFLVYDVPNLGITPRFAVFGAAVAGLATQATQGWNAGLNATLTGLRAGGLDVDVVPLFDLQASAVANPAAFGFNAATINQPCFVPPSASAAASLCSNPAQYFYWDSFHPTARGHELIAAAALRAVVPAPATAALLAMSLGLMAFMGQQNRRQKRRQYRQQ